MPKIRCHECKYWMEVGYEHRRRCTVAAPFKGKNDKAKVALTTRLDGCAKGKRKKEDAVAE